MKLLRVGDKGKEKPALLDSQNNFRDLSKIISDFKPQNLNFETLKKIKDQEINSLPVINKKERIGPCIINPSNFFAIGLNYKAHAEETNSAAPKEPIVFNKSPNCIIGPYDDVVIPKDSKCLDHEVEIALVIGKKAKYVDHNNAQEFVLGYCICNDISERDWQKNKGGQWVKGKSGDTFGPIGPYLVTKDEIKDINNLNMSLDLNGKRMQSGNTSTMIFNVDIIVSYVSKFMSLQAGDIITTGTPPGVGMGKKPQIFLKEGDKLKLTIDNLGEQNSQIVAI